MWSRLLPLLFASTSLAGAPTLAASAPSTPGTRVVVHARGLHGPVTLKLEPGSTLEVAADGAFAFQGTLAPGVAFEVKVVSQPPGDACKLTPAAGKASGHELRLDLECRDAPPTARPMMPADKASAVSPLLGRVVLVISKPLIEPPAGTFLLESRDGEAWIDTGLQAKAEYKADTREWRFVLGSRAFPPNKVLRVTIVPTAGKDAKREPLSREPIRWSFSTGANPLDAARARPDGGCPVGTEGSKPTEPCDKP